MSRYILIHLPRLSDQETLIGALFDIGIHYCSQPTKEEAILRWRFDDGKDGKDGNAWYEYIVLSKELVFNGFHSGPIPKEYTPLNSINHFVTCARRFKSDV